MYPSFGLEVGLARGVRDSDVGGNLVEESGYRLQAAILDQDEVRAFDHVSFGFRAERPGKADLIAIAVGVTVEREAKTGKAVLHCRDQRADLVMPFPAISGST